MKAQGIDLIDVSSGALVPAQIPVGPGYRCRARPPCAPARRSPWRLSA
ncbi:hypothetical protein [Teichococcus aestuarii]